MCYKKEVRSASGKAAGSFVGSVLESGVKNYGKRQSQYRHGQIKNTHSLVVDLTVIMLNAQKNNAKRNPPIKIDIASGTKRGIRRA